MLGFTEVIARDHRVLLAGFDDFLRTGSGRTARALCDQLERHTVAEECSLYPLLRSLGVPSDPLAHTAAEAHDRARGLADRARRTAHVEHLRAIIRELHSCMERHFRIEESAILPRVLTLGAELGAALETFERVRRGGDPTTPVGDA